MKKKDNLDEMERNIQTRAAALGYRAAILVLSIWGIYSGCKTLICDAPHNPLPGGILCIVLLVRGISEAAQKQRMTAGDEEYRTPNLVSRYILKIVGIALILTAAILVFGFFFILYPRIYD